MSIVLMANLVLSTLLVIALVWGGLMMVRGIRAHARLTGEPQCNRCGYSVRGLTNWRCPECSSDLLEVGVRGWAQLADRTPSKVSLAANWFALLVIGGGFATALVVIAWSGYAARAGVSDDVRDVTTRWIMIGMGVGTLAVWGLTLWLALRYIRRRQAALREAVARRGITPFPSVPADPSAPRAPTVPPVDENTGPGSSVG